MIPQLIIKSKTDLTGILYSRGWGQKIFLDGELSQPIYQFTEQGRETHLGQFVPSIKNWEKVLTITIPVHDALYLALETAAMCSDLKLIDELGNLHSVAQMDIEVQWARSGFGKATLKLTVGKTQWQNSLSDLRTGNETTDSAMDIRLYQITQMFTESELGDAYLDPWVVGGVFETNPENMTGNIYLLGEGVETSVITGRINELTATGWKHRSDLEIAGTLFIGTDENVARYYLNTDGKFYLTPSFSDIGNPSGNDYIIFGWIIPNTFVQAYYSVDEITWLPIGLPITSNVFNQHGLLITMPDANYYYLNIECYTHATNYGMAITYGHT